MKHKKVSIIVLCALIPYGINAQGTFEEFKSKLEGEYSSFRNKRDKEYENFRNKINTEYASLLKKAWKEFNAFKAIPVPNKDKPIPPVIYPDNEDKDRPIKDNQKSFEEIVPVVKPVPQPEPIVPIEEMPILQEDTYYTFRFFNTNLKVRMSDKLRFVLHSCDEKEISRIWSTLSGTNYNNVINDCIGIRSQYKLCDWAYLLMLRDLANSFFEENSNEAVLFTAFLYCQSGYKMRLASAGNELYLLYASNHTIYNVNYWEIDGEKFYPLNCKLSQLHICQVTFPKEKPLSLLIPTEQLFAVQNSAQRSLQSKRFPEITAMVNINENLVKFFDTYPASMINEDFGTRWAMYANTPLSRQARNSLYPSLKSAIEGRKQADAVNRLLNFVQTAFVYEYDDKVWGYDRAFFPDESLYYPYCDCEDRSIIFSRLVRDLLGLKVVLIYYPGHLATAVLFTENVTGDYILMNGKRYVVCDPTYIGAPVGVTMPKMDNAKAKIILLE